MPAVTVQCPHCSQSYSVDNTHAGRKARCKGCGQTFSLNPSREIAAPQPISGLPSTLTSEPTPTALARAFPIPETIGRFVVKQRLGAGAFGTVYRATDPTLGREVALKVPQPGLLHSPTAAERFLREARAAAQLRHPNIVTLFETGIDRGEHYLATEFIDGTVLADAVGEAGLEPRRAAEIIAALADALHFAHARGIVHRDVKPANVMLDREGRPHLMDFGLARFEGASGEKLTQDGAILGTPAYMAPEQATASGTEITAASDQYSLGATLYELLTGRTPFSGPPEIVIFNLAHRDPPAPRTLRPEIPAALETICLKAMAKAPADRYTTCQGLADDLRRWLQDVPIHARRVATSAKLGRWLRANRLAAGLAACLVVGLLVLGGWVVGTIVPATSSLATWKSDEAAIGSGPSASEPIVPDATKADPERPKSRPSVADVPVADTTPTKTKPPPPATPTEPPKPDPRPAYAGRIQAAYMAGKDGRRTEAERLLDDCPADLRGWEWSYLKRMIRSHPAILAGHNGPVHCVAFSPDGKRLASGGEDRTVRIWDAVAGTGTARNGHAAPVTDIAFKADGSHIVSFGWDGLMEEWDLSSDKPIRRVPILFRGLAAVAISLDAKWIAGGWTDGKIHVCSTENGLEDFGAEQERSKPIVRVAFSPDGQKILSRTIDGWTIRYRGEVLQAQKRPLKKLINIRPRVDAIPRKSGAAGKGDTTEFEQVAASPDGRHVAAAAGNEVLLYDIETGALVRRSRWHPKKVTALAFSRDGKWLAADGDDRTVHIWEAATGRWRTSLQGHKDELTCIRFGKDDSLLAGSSRDGNVYVWRVGDGVVERTVELAGATAERREGLFSGDSNTLYLIEKGEGKPTSLSSWDAATGRRIRKADGIIGTSPDLSRVVAFDSGRVAVRDSEGRAASRQLAIDEAALRPEGAKGSVSTRVLLLDESRCAILVQRKNGPSDASHMVGVWDEKRGGWAWSQTYEGSAYLLGGVALRTSPQSLHGAADCDGLIYRRDDRTICVLSALDGSEVLTQPGRSYQVSPRGGLVAILPDDSSHPAAIWDLERKQPVIEFHGGRVAFDPSGKRLATWGAQKPGVAVWDLATRRRVLDLTSFDGDAAFSPDGRRLAARRGRSLVILDAATGGELLELPDSPGTPIFSPDGLKLACLGETLTIRSADHPEVKPAAR